MWTNGMVPGLRPHYWYVGSSQIWLGTLGTFCEEARMMSGIFVLSFVLLLTIGMELTWSCKK